MIGVTARRGFLKAIAAIPLAAQSAAAAIAAEASSLGAAVGTIKVAEGYYALTGGEKVRVSTDEPIAKGSYGPSWQTKLARVLRGKRIPKRAAEIMWSYAAPPPTLDALDPDLREMKSWSLSAKLHAQRVRNYEQRMRRLREGNPLQDYANEFVEKFGVHLE